MPVVGSAIRFQPYGQKGFHSMISTCRFTDRHFANPLKYMNTNVAGVGMETDDSVRNAGEGDPEPLICFIDAGGDPSARDRNGGTALIAAVKQGRYEQVM
jgi:ankyrin repeat protein